MSLPETGSHLRSDEVYISETESDTTSEDEAVPAHANPTSPSTLPRQHSNAPVVPRDVILPPDDCPDPDGRCFLLDGQLVLSYRGEIYKEGDGIYLIPSHYGGSKFWIGVIESIQDITVTAETVSVILCAQPLKLSPRVG
jgi:hypothetical protein